MKHKIKSDSEAISIMNEAEIDPKDLGKYKAIDISISPKYEDCKMIFKEVIDEAISELKKDLEISNKRMITPKEFEKLYGISRDSQSQLRGRIYDHLPYTRVSERGNILYNVKEIEQWFENRDITRTSHKRVSKQGTGNLKY